MSYFEKTAITLADNGNGDAFQRLRVAEPFTIFDSKQLYFDNTLIWSTLTNGNATSSFLPNNACMILTASGSNSSVVRQTKKRHNYQSGKAQGIVFTGNFNTQPQVSVIKRVGYFSQTDGIGFMSSGSSFGVFLRTNTSGTPSDTFISQSNWNLDTMNGAGPSGNTLNLTASQIFFMDFEWLGVGRIRYGIFHGGIPIYVHQITNTNVLSTVFMSSPNQPIRYEVINSGSVPTSLTHICSTVTSEGGLQNNGAVKAISNFSALSLTAGGYYGMIALRLSASCLDAGIIPLDTSVATTTTTAIYEVALLLNPSGSLPWVWQNLPNSPIQYATGSAAFTIATEGNKQYSTMGASSTVAAQIQFDPTFALGSDVTGSQDILVLAVRDINGTMANVCSTLSWRES